MNQLTVNGHTALDYAEMACKALMKKFAPEDLPRIFERGYTGNNGRIDRQATGLGLYLCRRILHQLGHGISIDSAVGRGTTVRLDLSVHHLEMND